MGHLFSHYQTTDFDESKIYTFNNDGDIQLNQFQTGDLIFFSEEFPDSSIARGFRRLQNRLWDNCGVVFYEPSLWPDQMMLLETANVHPDDYLIDKLQLTNTGAGMRLVSLSDRIKSMKFEAIGVRKVRPREMLQPTAVDQFAHAKVLRPLQDQKISQEQFAVEALKALGIIKVPYARPSINALTGSALDRLAKYHKLEVYAFKQLKDNTSVSPNLRLAKK
jgi:hypothetical protein